VTFEGRCFVVMGAASEVGGAVCRMLAENGAALFMTGRDGEKLEALRKDMENPDKHMIFPAPLEEEAFAHISSVLGQFLKDRNYSGVGGGVYCPGYAPLLPLQAVSFDSIEEVFRVNYSGALMMARMLSAKGVRHPGGGSIVFITSVRAGRGAKALSLYCGAKAALAASCRALALELARFRIRINCIAPGTLVTEMNMKAGRMSDTYLESMKAAHPLGTGSPKHVANAVVFLLSDESEWITGTEIVVDGGFLAG